MAGRGMLHVHRGERADALAAALADVLADPSDDLLSACSPVFAGEVVAVGGRGTARWLAQRLSHRLGAAPGSGAGDGVCAGVDFPSPPMLIDRAVGAAADDPWAPGRLVWPLLEVIDECADEAWCAALGAHVRGRAGRRVAAARRLAALFAGYGEHRPAMLRAWAAKEEDGADGPGAVDADLAWQPELWRRLRDRVGVPSPAELAPERCARLRADPSSCDLPARVSLFGPVRLTTSDLEVLAALATHREVHLWVPHPSPASWARLGGGPDPAHGRAEDTAADAVAHPLLASLGRDLRELQGRLHRLDAAVTEHHHPGDEAADRPTVLARLQADLRDDRAPSVRVDDPDTADASLTVHACHGPDRQVEVLREAVLGLLARDPTLEARDVVVLCPDLETYAPLITATFGLGADQPHPGHRLPVRLADRTLRQVNPLLGTVARLLELADARVTASELLDLAESGPVRRRFGFDDDALDAVRELVAAAGIRWGLDAEHRRPFGLHGYPQNSWAAGLDRLLLGVAMSEEEHRWLGTALPLDEVDSDVVDLVGRLAELVARVTVVLDELTGERPLAHWTATLTDALDALTAVSPAEAWQLTQARAELSEVADGAGDAPLSLADVRGVLADRLAGRPARANFRTGALTVATPAPLRAVPHRVVCLLGLDDGVFPREGAADGDDVLARDPRPGDPDPRADDRAALLDAIGAAVDHLVVVHSGADERTGATRPPAVPVGELLDVVGRGVVVEHPLQPFDARNFRPGSPFSFDAGALDGARRVAARASGAREEPRRFLDGPLPPVEATGTTLDELLRFVAHPVQAFLRQRLGLAAASDEPDHDDALPIEIRGLTEWSVGERLLEDRLAGSGPEQCRQAEWRRGVLPPGALGHRELERIQATVEPLVELALRVRTGAVRAVDVDLSVEVHGRPHRLVGTVGGLYDAHLLTVTYSRVAAKHRLRAWVQLLALTAQTGHELRAVVLGRGRGDRLARCELGPVPPERARGILADLLALRAEGLRAPLPLPPRTVCAWAEARRRGAEPDDAWAAAEQEWAGRYGERTDAAHLRVWGPVGLASLARAELEAGATRLWQPLLAVERKETPR